MHCCVCILICQCYHLLGISVIFEAEEQQDLSPEVAAGDQLSNEFASLSTRTVPPSTGSLLSQHTGVNAAAPVRNQTTAVINTVQQPSSHLLTTSQSGLTIVTSSITQQASSHQSTSSVPPFMLQQHVVSSDPGLYSSTH